MNAKDKLISKRATRLAAVSVLLWVVMFFLIFKSNAQCVGEAYLTSVNTEQSMRLKYQKDLEGVRIFAEPYNIGNVEIHLTGSDFFDFKTQSVYLYVERKAVYKTKSGKLAYKKMNKKRRKDVQSYIRKNKLNKSM